MSFSVTKAPKTQPASSLQLTKEQNMDLKLERSNKAHTPNPPGPSACVKYTQEGSGRADSKRQSLDVSGKGIFSDKPALTVVLNKSSDVALAGPPHPDPPRDWSVCCLDTTVRADPLQEGTPAGCCSRAAGLDPGRRAKTATSGRRGQCCGPGQGGVGSCPVRRARGRRLLLSALPATDSPTGWF